MGNSSSKSKTSNSHNTNMSSVSSIRRKIQDVEVIGFDACREGKVLISDDKAILKEESLSSVSNVWRCNRKDDKRDEKSDEDACSSLKPSSVSFCNSLEESNEINRGSKNSYSYNDKKTPLVSNKTRRERRKIEHEENEKINSLESRNSVDDREENCRVNSELMIPEGSISPSSTLTMSPGSMKKRISTLNNYTNHYHHRYGFYKNIKTKNKVPNCSKKTYRKRSLKKVHRHPSDSLSGSSRGEKELKVKCLKEEGDEKTVSTTHELQMEMKKIMNIVQNHPEMDDDELYEASISSSFNCSKSEANIECCSNSSKSKSEKKDLSNDDCCNGSSNLCNRATIKISNKTLENKTKYSCATSNKVILDSNLNDSSITSPPAISKRASEDLSFLFSPNYVGRVNKRHHQRKMKIKKKQMCTDCLALSGKPFFAAEMNQVLEQQNTASKVQDEKKAKGKKSYSYSAASSTPAVTQCSHYHLEERQEEIENPNIYSIKVETDRKLDSNPVSSNKQIQLKLNQAKLKLNKENNDQAPLKVNHGKNEKAQLNLKEEKDEQDHLILNEGKKQMQLMMKEENNRQAKLKLNEEKEKKIQLRLNEEKEKKIQLRLNQEKEKQAQLMLNQEKEKQAQVRLNKKKEKQIQLRLNQEKEKQIQLRLNQEKEKQVQLRLNQEKEKQIQLRLNQEKENQAQLRLNQEKENQAQLKLNEEKYRKAQPMMNEKKKNYPPMKRLLGTNLENSFNVELDEKSHQSLSGFKVKQDEKSYQSLSRIMLKKEKPTKHVIPHKKSPSPRKFSLTKKKVTGTGNVSKLVQQINSRFQNLDLDQENVHQKKTVNAPDVPPATATAIGFHRSGTQVDDRLKRTRPLFRNNRRETSGSNVLAPCRTKEKTNELFLDSDDDESQITRKNEMKSMVVKQRNSSSEDEETFSFATLTRSISSESDTSSYDFIDNLLKHNIHESFAFPSTRSDSSDQKSNHSKQVSFSITSDDDSFKTTNNNNNNKNSFFQDNTNFTTNEKENIQNYNPYNNNTAANTSSHELCLSPVQKTPQQARKWRTLKAAVEEKDLKQSSRKKNILKNPLKERRSNCSNLRRSILYQHFY